MSAFLKIEQLPLVRQFYQVQELLVPPAVYREVAITDLLSRLAALSWIRLTMPSPSQTHVLSGTEGFERLGRGEQEAIALALEQKAILLVNDNQARRLARQLGIQAVNIPAFLLACKMAGLLDRDALSDLVTGLREKDYYGFRQDVLDLLLS